MKGLKNLPLKAETYEEPKRVSVMVLFLVNNLFFSEKAPS